MKWIAAPLIFLFLGCGVKGDPRPPLEPAVIGSGQPRFSKATEKLKLKKKNQNYKNEDDWNEPSDFEEKPE